MASLYKVLENGRSCFGGQMKWSLPRRNGSGWIPGEWHEAAGPLHPCKRGIHLTSDPLRWWYIWNCEVYLAEFSGDHIDAGDKIVVRKARLLEPKAHPQWWLDAHQFVDSLKGIPCLQASQPLDTQWRHHASRKAAWESAWKTARNTPGNTAGDAALETARNIARLAGRQAAANAALEVAGNAAWKVAWNAAGDPTWDYAREVAEDATWDAAAFVLAMHICDGLELADQHKRHLAARMDVWRRGYGLLCDVRGVLFTYGR